MAAIFSFVSFLLECVYFRLANDPTADSKLEAILEELDSDPETPGMQTPLPDWLDGLLSRWMGELSQASDEAAREGENVQPDQPQQRTADAPKYERKRRDWRG